MRITMNNIYGSIINNLDRLSDDMRRINDSISSGKKYSWPSDDPISLISALEIRSRIQEVDQYKRNVDYAVSWMNSSELALRQTDDVLTRTREIAVQMASATQNAATRAAAATEVDELIKQTVALGNTELGGKYIFGGAKTDVIPFTNNGAAVSYNGDDKNINIRIGRNDDLETSRNGLDAFMDGNAASNLFTHLIDLKTALEDNDAESIRNSLGNLGSDSDFINVQISSFGAKQGRLDIKKSIYEELQLSNKEKLSDTEDTDLAEAMTSLHTKEYAYQAALVAASKVMQMSLVDFMK